MKECFVDAFQGMRWCFRIQKDDPNKVNMEDTLGQFKDVEMSVSMAEVLSQQLGLLQQYQDSDRKQLLLPNLLLDFIRENKDVDKDVIIALIENITYGNE